MSWAPHTTVSTVIERNGQFLMVEEYASNLVVINQPAGHLEENETLENAAIRETKEETGWVIEIDYIIGFYLYKSEHNKTTYLRTCFHGNAVRELEDYQLDNGIIRANWMTYHEIQSLPKSKLRSPLVIKCIDDYLKGKRFPLSLIEHVS